MTTTANRKTKGIIGGDSRLAKSAGSKVRGDRKSSDDNRDQLDGTVLSAKERRRQLREEWVQEVLPKPPEIQGFHCCWLSTTSSVDPIYKRVQIGYEPVRVSEVKGLESFTGRGGDYDGCVVCNEMVLFKISE